VEAQTTVTYGVDTAVDAVELTFALTDRDRFRTEAARVELPSRNRPVLASGDFRCGRIWRVEFCVHTDA
jgi:hypothetical protein